jgi:dolichyl-phosphate-mannose-protein mannosyltransferase
MAERQRSAPLMPSWAGTARGGTRAEPRTRAASGSRARLLAVTLAVALAAATCAVRAFHLTYSVDLFVDEVTYTDLTRHLVEQGRLASASGPFYLHGPVYFLLAAGWWHIANPGAGILQQVYALRWATVGMAVALDAALFVLAYRWRGLGAALIVAALYAIDPFLTRWSSLVMLETATVLWAVIGMALLAGRVRDERRVSTPLAVATGIAFGLSILTKDNAVFITLVPCGLLLVAERRAALKYRPVTIVASAVATYLLYIGWIAAFGDLHTFWNQKSRGFSRALGIIQESGFHRRGATPFSQVVLEHLARYGVTYALIALGAVAAIILFRSRGHANRLAAALYLGPLAYLGYAVVYGTLEEQFFYYLVVSSILVTALAAPLVIARVRRQGSSGSARRRRLAAVMVGVAVVAALGYNTQVWASLRSRPDNGYARLLAFLAHDLPARSRVGVDTGDPLWIAVSRTQPDRVAQVQGVLFDNQVIGPWSSRKRVRAEAAAYMVVNDKLVSGHYLVGSQGFYAWVRAHGTVVFEFEDDSYQRLVVYKLPPP